MDHAAFAKIYLFTDGKAGDLTQLLGVSTAVGGAVEIRQVSPRAIFSVGMPWFGIDPRDKFATKENPLRPPFPEIAIATGRRTVTYLKAFKKLSPRTFTVFLKDPRTGTGAADLIWVQAHDKLRGHNVFTTATSPHKLSGAEIASHRESPDPRLKPLAMPRVAVFAGGPSSAFDFSQADIDRFLAALSEAAGQVGAFMISTSRRTPPNLAQALAAFARQGDHFFWDGSGSNPYIAMMALADAVIVTADSTNMISEAAATGRHIHIFWPKGKSGKIDRLLANLGGKAAVSNFTGTLEWTHYPPLDATEEIAQEIHLRYAEFRARVGPLPQ